MSNLKSLTENGSSVPGDVSQIVNNPRPAIANRCPACNNEQLKFDGKGYSLCCRAVWEPSAQKSCAQPAFATLAGANSFTLFKLGCMKTAIEKLNGRLLQIGGNKVREEFYVSREEIGIIVKFGRRFESTNVKLRRGRPMRCHDNSLKLWARNRNEYTLVTGYGMCVDDQTWYRHSWLIDVDGSIVETTKPRDVYFGAVYSPQGAEILSEMVFQRGEWVFRPHPWLWATGDCLPPRSRMPRQLSLFTRDLLGSR